MIDNIKITTWISLTKINIVQLSLLISLLQFLYEFCRLVHGFFSVLVLLPIYVVKRKVTVILSLSPLREKERQKDWLSLEHFLFRWSA